MELIDTHVHFLYPDRFSYAWCRGQPILDRAFRIEDYRAAAEGAPVQAMVFMEADVPPSEQKAEMEFFSRLAAEDRESPPLAAIVAAAWPEAADFSAQVAQLASNGRVRGLRRVLHTMPDGLALTLPFVEHLGLLPQYGFSFSLCLRPRLIPAATELAARCPATEFILDHCGVPAVAAGELDPWRESVRRLAARPNVTCKFSGLASLCDPLRPMTPQVRPFFEHCLECFGPARMMWGSDWPLCNLTFNLAAWLETTDDLLGDLSRDEQRTIASGTARRIYRL